MSKHIKRVGLTGGIGSGKSTCAFIFEQLGIPVYYSDLRAKQLINTDPKIKTQLIEAFGLECYLEDGTLNRIHLRKLVFGDQVNTATMNKIVHPAVRRDFIDWSMRHQSSKYVLQESALLFETGSYRLFDLNILVDAPESLRIKRVMDRDSISEQDVRNRVDKQLPSTKKRQLANYIIDNDGNRGLMKQVIETHLKILQS